MALHLVHSESSLHSAQWAEQLEQDEPSPVENWPVGHSSQTKPLLFPAVDAEG